jgi:dihydrofolate reductase
MRKIVLFMHTSLDGFVAGPNGEMDWIKVDNEIFDYVGKRTDQSDTALYGRVTYDLMEGYWPTAAEKPGATKHTIDHSKWYASVSKIVASRTMKGKNPKNTKIISENIQNEILKIKETEGKEILVFGSPSVGHVLMQHNLIDEYWLFVNPVLLGKGIPLFKDIQELKKLKLMKSHVFSSGVNCVNYSGI